MTHHDKGHFAAKHPTGPRPDDHLTEAVKSAAQNGGLSCEAAHELAETLGVAANAVGKSADLLELRLLACQLGLFGYGPRRKIVSAASHVDPHLADALQRASRERRISCLACWEIADRTGLPRLEISRACEALGLRITRCQLGAF